MKKSQSLTISPEWDEIETVRNKCSEFLLENGLSETVIHAGAMVVSELLENSIKYGDFSNKKSDVGVIISISSHTITIEVSNPVNEVAYGYLDTLDKTIQWIRGFQDPFQAYIDMLKEVSRRPMSDDNSGLGLVRVAYEGDAILDFYVSDEGILNVSAIMEF
jgi:hypothetical protein